jgi:hypothetical protein
MEGIGLEKEIHSPHFGSPTRKEEITAPTEPAPENANAGTRSRREGRSPGLLHCVRLPSGFRQWQMERS